MGDDRELFLLFIRPLNRMGVDYMVTGSAASMAYGEPRVTLDIDLVVEISKAQAALLSIAFPSPAFYCPPRESMVVEIERPAGGHFNIIHQETGFKADIYPAGKDPLHRWAMGRRRRVDMQEEPVMLAPPEYVILRKLEFFKEGGSEKHLRDIRSMLEVSRDQVNDEELMTHIKERGLVQVWERVSELPL